MDLMFFINALLRKKWVIIICTLAGLCGALLFTLTKKNMYLSAATYSTGFTMKQQVKMTTDEGLNIFEIDQRFKNVIETFKSPVVISMLSYDLMLHDLTEEMPFTRLSAKAKSKTAYTQVNLEKAKQLLLQKKARKEMLRVFDVEENKVNDLIELYKYDNESILDELTVDRVTGTDYLNIIYRSENPQMSAFVVNTLGKEFISFFTSIMTTRTTESAGKLDTLAARKRKEIDDKTRQLSEYKKSFNSPNINDRSTAALEMVKDQQSQLSAEMAKLNGLKADLVSVAQKLQSMGSGADNTSAINTELLELQQKNRDLAVDLQKKGGSDASIEALIAANQKRIAQLQPSYSSAADRAERRKRIEDLTLQKISINNDIEAQNQTIGSLQAGLRNYNTIASSGAGAEVIADAIQIDIDRLNKEYEQMTHQLQNAENVNVAPEINFKQTLVGQAAIKPERSGRKMIIAVTSLAALMISSLWIIIMDFLDQSVRTPSLFNKLVNLRLLAITSKIDLKNRIMDDYFSVQADPKNNDSAFSYLDSLRKLRYEIEASGKKIILFTSTKPQEGKSTIIEGLANSFSLSRKKVLLIDTNFSNNSLTEKFQAKPLLDQFSLNGAANVMEKLASIKSSTKIPSVDIIGCKETALSPDELLRDNNLLEKLSSVSQSYDYVFMEGAALNNHADTKELLKYADAVIIIFSAGSVIRQTDKDAIRFLKSHKEKLVGAVLNGVEKDNIDM